MRRIVWLNARMTRTQVSIAGKIPLPPEFQLPVNYSDQCRGAAGQTYARPADSAADKIWGESIQMWYYGADEYGLLVGPDDKLKPNWRTMKDTHFKIMVDQRYGYV